MDEQVLRAPSTINGTMEAVGKEYKPKKQEILRDYEINIRFLSVGCIISIGCKQIPFRSVKEAMDELNKYINNPYEEREKWFKIIDEVE
jgi:hypothetical protein